MLNNIAIEYNPYISGSVTYASVNKFVSKSNYCDYQLTTTDFNSASLISLLYHPFQTITSVIRNKIMKNKLLHLYCICSMGEN